MKVVFYTWSLEKGDSETIDRIKSFLVTLMEKDIESEVIELASYGEILHEPPAWGIAFGSMRGISDPEGMVTELPALSCLTRKKENAKWRDGALESLKMIAEAAKKGTIEKEKEEEVKVYVETDEGHTVGKKDTDFVIDEVTAEYARKIKDLVGGSAYMEKNGIRVEIK